MKLKNKFIVKKDQGGYFKIYIKKWWSPFSFYLCLTYQESQIPKIIETYKYKKIYY